MIDVLRTGTASVYVCVRGLKCSNIYTSRIRSVQDSLLRAVSHVESLPETCRRFPPSLSLTREIKEVNLTSPRSATIHAAVQRETFELGRDPVDVNRSEPVLWPFDAVYPAARNNFLSSLDLTVIFKS